MEYFEILDLKREPFSNSPDPDFFFQSRQHLDCLQKLEIAVRLRRGLNAVVGEVGTGKTTLCRQLIRILAPDADIEAHLILDPCFSTPTDLLKAVAGMFGICDAFQNNADNTNLKERIKQYLFRRGVDEGRIIVLIIDEGQKIPADCLELLRELLNFETNEYKLLQIVIFAQKEFETTTREYANFTDRINLYHRLGPLNYRDTCRLIGFRLEQSGSEEGATRFFSRPSMWAIHKATGGYPRKIINLCHSCMLAIIIQNRSKAGWFLVRSCIKRKFPEKRKRRNRLILAMGCGAATVVTLLLTFNQWGSSFFVHTAPPVVAENSIQEQGCGKNESDMTQTRQLPSSLPLFIGRLAMNKGESLSKMIQQVYGEFNAHYLEAVLRANPTILKVASIEAGKMINFPAIQAAVRSTDLKCWWIKLDEKDDLTEALSQLRKCRDQGVLVRLIPSFHPRDGLKFSVILREYLIEESEVRKRLEELPEGFSSRAERVATWGDEQTVLFADPYLM